MKVLFISEYFLEAQGGGERSAAKLINAINLDTMKPIRTVNWSRD